MSRKFVAEILFHLEVYFIKLIEKLIQTKTLLIFVFSRTDEFYTLYGFSCGISLKIFYTPSTAIFKSFTKLEKSFSRLNKTPVGKRKS